MQFMYGPFQGPRVEEVQCMAAMHECSSLEHSCPAKLQQLRAAPRDCVPGKSSPPKDDFLEQLLATCVPTSDDGGEWLVKHRGDVQKLRIVLSYQC